MRPISDEDATTARQPCQHPDVRYSADEKGAIACYACGRLFGHLEGETFHAFNPQLTAAELVRALLAERQAREPERKQA